MKQLGVFLLPPGCYSPLDGMLVHHRVTPSVKFASAHFCTCVERVALKVKCLAQKQNTMCLARAPIRTARSVDERASYEITAPPTSEEDLQKKIHEAYSGGRISW